jgi:hypothetical protein
VDRLFLPRFFSLSVFRFGLSSGFLDQKEISTNELLALLERAPS